MLTLPQALKCGCWRGVFLPRPPQSTDYLFPFYASKNPRCHLCYETSSHSSPLSTSPASHSFACLPTRTCPCANRRDTALRNFCFMPRPKVTEEARRRVLKACFRCQNTKSKCDGRMPCGLCNKRGESLRCAYSAAERSYGGQRRRRKAQRQDFPPVSSPSSVTGTPTNVSSPHGQTRLVTRSQTTGQVSNPRAIPGMKASQVLHDTQGRISTYTPVASRTADALADSLQSIPG
jgi:hypothetical protein